MCSTFMQLLKLYRQFCKSISSHIEMLLFQMWLCMDPILMIVLCAVPCNFTFGLNPVVLSLLLQRRALPSMLVAHSCLLQHL